MQWSRGLGDGKTAPGLQDQLCPLLLCDIGHEVWRILNSSSKRCCSEKKCCSEVLSGHDPRGPFATWAPTPPLCRPGATRQTCPNVFSEGDLKVTLQLWKLIHPTSPIGLDETVSFQSFSATNCYYFFRFYATIKGKLQFPAAATPPINQKNMTFILQKTK